jgi:tripeptidyl-peptidase-1
MVRKLCYSYLQLAALGTSVIFSSGDGGVSGNFPTECPDRGRFVPSFPSTCPYVTSVGATTGATGHLGSFPKETSLNLSSGGFSDVFERPWWQESDVDGYLRFLGRKNTRRFNHRGRGFPDVSAYGSDIPIIINGGAIKFGGTSASAPIFASIVALLNDRLIARGRPTLGFLNPMIYATRTKREGAWRDVKSGSNPGCNTAGFEAVRGWDPVTGVGSPDFEGLVRAIGAW